MAEHNPRTYPEGATTGRTKSEGFVWDYYFHSQYDIAKSLEFSMFHADESLQLFRELTPERKAEVLEVLGFSTS